MEESLAHSEVSTFLLQEFDTELDFCSQIGYVSGILHSNIIINSISFLMYVELCSKQRGKVLIF